MNMFSGGVCEQIKMHFCQPAGTPHSLTGINIISHLLFSHFEVVDLLHNLTLYDTVLEAMAPQARDWSQL